MANDPSDYLERRRLRTGAAGWVLLAGLGVSYVISGDYSGWNFGLAEGGFGGLLIAGVVIAAMYFAMVLGMAELSSALPAAGGGYTFARRALGTWGGFATGTAILIEYAIAPAAIATFIGAYVESLGLFGITDGWWVYLAAYVLFIGIHIAGVGETLKVAGLLRRGIVAAMLVLLVTGALVLVLATGALGAQALSESGNPLVEALGGSTAGVVVNYVGLAGLVASFFSIIYAYSRQTFALSRAGYLPRALSVTNGRKAPTLALVVPGVIGFLLSLTGQGAVLLNMAVFGAALSYVLMMVSHIVLRRTTPEMPRPYRTPGGVATTGFALVVAVLAVVATFLVDLVAAGATLGAFTLFMLYFALYSRHHLVAAAPDEEFAALARAEEELT